MNRSTLHSTFNRIAGQCPLSHFLAHARQDLRNDVQHKSLGRLRSIGYGAAELDQFVWGEGSQDTYCFAADFYLYIILVLLNTAKYSGLLYDSNIVKEFFRCFYWSDGVENPADPRSYRSASVIDLAFPGKHAYRFGLDQDLSKGAALDSVCVFDKSDSMDGRRRSITVDDVAWFDAARRSSGLGIPDPS